MSERFEVVEFPGQESQQIDQKISGDDKIKYALADNMGSIISIAKDIVDIRRMQVQSEALLQKMEKDKAMLLAEADAYVKRKNADTKQIVDKMQIARELLKDFYAQKNTAGVTGEEFSMVIKTIFEMQNGI